MTSMRSMEPLKIGNMTLKNRLALPPMGTDFAVSGQHEVSERFVRYMEERARGQLGLLINEYIAVSPAGLASPRQLGLWHDDFIAGFRQLVIAVHRHGAALVAQLHHAGRETSPAIIGQTPVAASALPSPRKGHAVRALEGGELPTVIADFARAAQRAQRAGFDGVELHGAHGYLIAGFMSPHGNHRDDEYGRVREGFLRFPLEVIAAVREAVGPDFAVGFRISGDEFVVDGRRLPETVAMAQELAAAGLDFLHVSAGTSQSLHTIIAPAAYPLGWNVEAAARVKEAVDIPVIAVGRIHEPQLAEEIVSSGKADVVALGRALLADPHFAAHTRKGQPDAIRRCLGCLGGCMDEPVACTQNPRLGHEASDPPPRALCRRRVLVIGGGVAGLEAARVAALRGHQVTLWEKEDQLGGQVHLACRPPHKERLMAAVTWRIEALELLGVTVRTQKLASSEAVLAHQTDAVIVATGAQPAFEDVPWKEELLTLSFADILHQVPPCQHFVVMGGGMLGLETAEFLAARQRKVTVLENGAHMGADMPLTARTLLLDRLHGAGVRRVTGVCDLDVRAGRVGGCVAGQLCSWPAETVVMARRRESVNSLCGELAAHGQEAIVIGDAKQPRRLLEAIAEADEAARRI